MVLGIILLVIALIVATPRQMVVYKGNSGEEKMGTGCFSFITNITKHTVTSSLADSACAVQSHSRRAQDPT